MTVQITATVSDTAYTWLVDTRLTSFDPIADPIAYVQDATVYGEILSRAGLDETLSLVDARLVGTGAINALLTYDMQITFGVPPVNTLTHQHDSTTARVGLGDSYGVSPLVTLAPTLGPVVIEYGDNTSVDYFRIRTDTDTTSRDVFFVQRTEAQFGAHQTFVDDASFDIGSADGGAILKRPRDLYLARDLSVGRNVSIAGTLDLDGPIEAFYSIYVPQASNPDPSPSTRLVYVNVDGTLRYWDGAAEFILDGSGAGTPTQGTYTCPGGVAIGDVVYSDGVGTCAAASAALLNGNPPLGIVTTKPTATSCTVAFIGEVTVPYAVVAGERYWVAQTAGDITIDDTLFVEGETACSIGVAKDSNTLVIHIGDPKRI